MVAVPQSGLGGLVQPITGLTLPILHARHYAAAASEARGGNSDSFFARLWDWWVQWSYRNYGGRVFPPKADICNCGVNFSCAIPRPELVYHKDIEQGSKEWKMQLHGAALYWYMATMLGTKAINADPDLLRGKDVLEVACMRGGGAHYLMEVARPRKYVATDVLAEHVELARKSRQVIPEGLEFAQADAAELAEKFEPGMFDFVLCVQGPANFSDLPRFAHGARHVLRPGGRLLICDAFSRGVAEKMVKALEYAGMEVETVNDIGRAVHAVGLCTLWSGQAYLHIVARRVELPSE